MVVTIMFPANHDLMFMCKFTSYLRITTPPPCPTTAI
jgi:hypothetical protein